MDPNIEITPTLYIVDNDYYYALRVKHSLGKKFGDHVNVNVFRDAESSVEAIKKTNFKPHVLIIDHSQNMEMAIKNGEHTVDAIKRISPNTRIVILSDEKSMDTAAKALAHGAQGFVLKDQFALAHIYSAVENCINPSKV